MSPETASLIARAQEVLVAAKEIHQWMEETSVFAREQREVAAKAGTTPHTSQDEHQAAARRQPR
jgi:hypothetical protein